MYLRILLATALLGSSWSAHSVRLTWERAPNVTSYEICYGHEPYQKPNCIDVGNVAETTILGLTDGTVYYFGSRTHNASGSSNLTYAIPYIATDNGGSSTLSKVLHAPDAVRSDSGNETFTVEELPEHGNTLVTIDTTGKFSIPDDATPHATWRFTPSLGGTYYGFGQLFAPHGGADSFHFRLDQVADDGTLIPLVWNGRVWHEWRLGANGAMVEDRMTSRDPDTRVRDTITFNLEASTTYEVRVAVRETGTGLYRLAFSTLEHYEFPPDPRTQQPYTVFDLYDCGYEGQVYVKQGVNTNETNDYYYPFEHLGTDEGTFGKVEDPQTTNVGRITCTVLVPNSGMYELFVRMHAPHDGSDSFWLLHPNSGVYHQVTTPKSTHRWMHAPVTLELEAGYNFLEFVPREDGAGFIKGVLRMK